MCPRGWGQVVSHLSILLPPSASSFHPLLFLSPLTPSCPCSFHPPLILPSPPAPSPPCPVTCGGPSFSWPEQEERGGDMLHPRLPGGDMLGVHVPVCLAVATVPATVSASAPSYLVLCGSTERGPIPTARFSVTSVMVITDHSPAPPPASSLTPLTPPPEEVASLRGHLVPQTLTDKATHFPVLRVRLSKAWVSICLIS